MLKINLLFRSSQAFKSANLRYRLTCIFLFLFPLAGNSVKSWTGTAFFVLALLGLFWIDRCRISLRTEEKALLTIVASIFLAWIISGIANGWGENQTKGLGVQVRALLFIPLYLLLRNNPSSLKWLGFGTIGGSIILFGQCLHDVYWRGLDRGYGLYDSPGLIAAHSLVFLVLLFAFFLKNHRENTLMRFLIISGLLCALGSLVISGSRSTYVTLLLLVPLSSFFFLPWRKALVILAMTTAGFMTLYTTNNIVKLQFNRGVSEVSKYIAEPNKLTAVHGSVGTRLEMWRAAIMLSTRNPVFGVGWRNFSEASKPLVEEGLVNGSAIANPHPHNLYLEFLVTAGVPGLLLLLALLAYPIYVAAKNRARNPLVSGLLTIFMIVYVINGINEGGALIYGNALSFFLVFLAVIFAELMRQPQDLRPLSARHNP